MYFRRERAEAHLVRIGDVLGIRLLPRLRHLRKCSHLISSAPTQFTPLPPFGCTQAGKRGGNAGATQDPGGKLARDDARRSLVAQHMTVDVVTADLHVVVRVHKQIESARLVEQRQKRDGGCDLPDNRLRSGRGRGGIDWDAHRARWDKAGSRLGQGWVKAGGGLGVCSEEGWGWARSGLGVGWEEGWEDG